MGNRETEDVYTVYATVEYKEDDGDHRLVLDDFCTAPEDTKKKCSDIMDSVWLGMKRDLEEWRNFLNDKLKK